MAAAAAGERARAPGWRDAGWQALLRSRPPVAAMEPSFCGGDRFRRVRASSPSLLAPRPPHPSTQAATAGSPPAHQQNNSRHCLLDRTPPRAVPSIPANQPVGKPVNHAWPPPLLACRSASHRPDLASAACWPNRPLPLHSPLSAAFYDHTMASTSVIAATFPPAHPCQLAAPSSNSSSG